jgi:hypothetical protein
MLLTDKLKKANDSVNVYFYDNGFMVEVSGSDHNDDWKTAKIMCNSLDEVMTVIKDASDMERN